MFYNIFKIRIRKDKVIDEIKKPEIVIDIHEKNSMIIAELSKSKELKIRINHLKIGDYLIGNIIIERKTVRDFISSMLNKRLMIQLNQMKKYDRRLIIIEGRKSDYELQNKNLAKSVKGYMVSIMTNQQIPIIKTKNYKETAKYLRIIAKQQQKKKQEVTLHSRIPQTIREQKRYILESFPKIGPKKSELLLKKFNSLKEIFDADEGELKEILKGQTKDFKDILGDKTFL